jgi:hypothetical protein
MTAARLPNLILNATTEGGVRVLMSNRGLDSDEFPASLHVGDSFDDTHDVALTTGARQRPLQLREPGCHSPDEGRSSVAHRRRRVLRQRRQPHRD